ncbi:MAG: acyl carrier protein [Planctomycetota bacterium]|jgi:acyl carrier protein
MSKEEIAAQVREIFRETLSIQPEKLQADTNLKNDLALDSLDMIEVVYEMEDRFDVQIPEEEIQEIATFDQIVDGLHAAIEAKGA